GLFTIAAMLRRHQPRQRPSTVRPTRCPGWLMALTEASDRVVGWDRLPLPLAFPVLAGIRMRMRERNLYDTATPRYTQAIEPPPPTDMGYLTARTADGTHNDLGDPAMGAAQ